ncbi:MAG: hypothetical protein IPJ28_15240, partial [Betaproteobacteria bacterium]|nr:hypothetical protein [Betaproteobacteria bacterium]
VEAFEAEPAGRAVANISARGRVLTGNDVMIGGFIIQGRCAADGGDSRSRAQPRAIWHRQRPGGPGAATFLGRHADRLERQLADGDECGRDPGFRDSAPSNANESAILITLAPGAYTAIVTGAGNTTGVGIIEVFAQ